MGDVAQPSGTGFSGGIYMKLADGTYVTVADENGNIDAPVTTTDLTTTGNTTLGNAVTDTTAINGATTITTTSASGLAVGRQGATAPVLKVDASTASVATGIQIKGAAAAGGVAVSAISSGSNENLTIDAKGSGTIAIAGTSTGAITLSRATGVTGAVTVTSAGANALAVGLAGATNPALNVDASTATSATGLNIKSAAAAGGVELSAISSGTNENLTVNAKGSGTIGFNTTAGCTGNILIGNGTDLNGMSVQGPSTFSSANSGALVVGPNGTTNPSLRVDASTATAATGLQVKSAAAAGGLAVSVLSSGADEALTIDAKGAGTITLAGTSTGNVVIPRTMAQGLNATDRAAVLGIYMSPANVAVTVPAITDPDIAKVDIDVSGAFSMQPAVGDAVIAIPQEAMEANARILGCYVTATDQITLVFGSEGGNVTGGAKNFKFLVLDLTA